MARGGIEALPYYRIEDRIAHVAAGGRTDIGYARMPGDDVLRITGSIAADADPVRLRVGIDDPARYAAFRLKALLIERGVRVTGTLATRHRVATGADDPAARGGAPVAHPSEPEALATLTPPPLIEDIRVTNKVSQNLHAELLLRRVGRVHGGGSIADGQAVVSAMLRQAGVERWRYDFADGSGMSNYKPRLAARRGAVSCAGRGRKAGARRGARRCQWAASTGRCGGGSAGPRWMANCSPRPAASTRPRRSQGS